MQRKEVLSEIQCSLGTRELTAVLVVCTGVISAASHRGCGRDHTA